MIITLNNTIYINLKLYLSFSLIRQDTVKIIYKLQRFARTALKLLNQEMLKDDRIIVR